MDPRAASRRGGGGARPARTARRRCGPPWTRALGAVIGHRLFTVLRYHADSRESERCYTNQPAAYPVGGRKPFNDSAWSRQVFGERRPYIGNTAEDIRTVFFDHALIASLGCDSVLNVPVVHDGRVLGTLNLLHEARLVRRGGRGAGACSSPRWRCRATSPSTSPPRDQPACAGRSTPA